MAEYLAANGGELASPEGAANEWGDAPPPAAQAAPVDEVLPDMAKAGETGNMTRNVARRIKEERQKACQELVDELFGSEENLAAYREQRNRAVADEAELATVNAYADLALAADPELGRYYLEHEQQVKELAAACGADLESAFLLLLRQQLPDILRGERQRGEQELLQKLAANSNTPGSLADGGRTEAGLFSLSDQEFAEMVTRVKRGEVKQI